MARLVPIVDEIRSLGAELYAIGNGAPQFIEGFVDEFDINFPVFTDPSREVFRAAGMRRGISKVFTFGTLKRGRKEKKAGHRQAKVQGDPWQLGGTLLVLRSGEVAWSYEASGAGDQIEPEALVAVLRQQLGVGTP